MAKPNKIPSINIILALQKYDMNKWLKLALWVFGVIFTLVAITWLSAAYYLNKNKKEVLATILAQLNKNMSGQITVGDMEPTLLKGFPGVSVSLNQVLLRDSLWAKHHHDLLNAADIDVNLNILSLFVGNISINRIAINNANVYLYTDTGGYSNTSIFKNNKPVKDKKQAKSPPAFAVEKIDFNHLNLVIDNQKRLKLFNFKIDQIKGRIKYPDSGWVGKIQLKTFINSFAFNTKKGSFLKNKTLEGTISAHYSKELDAIIANPEPLLIGGHPYKIGAKIDLNKSAFAINISVDNVLFKDVALLLSPNISSKLLKFSIDKPVNIRGNISDDGTGKYRDPLVKVSLFVRDNVVTIPAGKLTACHFVGTFTNKDTLNGTIGDENSAIMFYKLKANYFNAPIKIDTFSVKNLSRPIAKGFVTSNFNLTNLNNSIGMQNFDFKNGTADLKLFCQADIDNFRFTRPLVSGKINVSNADIVYLPRNLRLIKSNLNINFNQNNLLIDNGHFQLGKSELNVSCSIANFLNLYYTAPDKIVVDLKMTSPQLYLHEFIPFLGPRNKHKKPEKQHNSPSASKQLSNVLEVSQMNINLKVDKAVYDRFMAKNLVANISILGSGIYLNQVNVVTSGGAINLSGSIEQNETANTFKANAKINHVGVKEFFYGFDNFGLSTLTSKNLKGYLSSMANISGRISPNGKIIPRSINGNVNFSLKNAALVNFEPIANVGKFVFPNRNLSNIELKNLNGNLTLRGDKIDISPMQISSTALNFNVKGVYALGTGTNLQMDIPLRNPKGDEKLTPEEKKEARMKGIVLHLKAVDNDKGGIKIRWNKDHEKTKSN